MSNTTVVEESQDVSAKQNGNDNELKVKKSTGISIEQTSSNSNDKIILLIAIGVIIGSFFFIFQGKSISKDFMQILYIFVSLSVAIIGNFLIGTINISYKNNEGIIKASGSMALFIFTFVSLKYSGL